MQSQKDGDAINAGQNVVVGGLVVQILFFGFFLIVAITFHRRLQKSLTSRSVLPSIPWHKHILVLYLTSILILERSVFRIIEYVQGNDGYILRHEAFLYTFDGVLMLGLVVLFNVVHPSEIYALLKGGKASRGLLKMEMVGKPNDEVV